MMILNILVGAFIGIYILLVAGLFFGSWALRGAGKKDEAMETSKVALSWRAESLLSMLWHMPPQMTIQEAHCKALETYGEDAYDECCRLFDKPEDRQGGE